MIDIFVYDQREARLRNDIPVDGLRDALKDENLSVWVDFTAPSDDETNLLDTIFGFDHLAIEDCKHDRQSPKLESFDDYHFFIVEGALPNPTDCAIIELDGFLGDRYLVTYHEEANIKAIQTQKALLAKGRGHLSKGTAYLAYDILDGIIDMYLPVLDHFDERINDLGTNLRRNRLSEQSAGHYLRLSGRLHRLRRTALKNQQVFYQFSHSRLAFIDGDEARLFRDIYDHVLRVADTSDYYQHTLREVLDIQLSLNTNRVNEIVKFLTIFATIMLPLNVITGVYGMNFDYMPFLHNPYGFWLAAGVMFFIIVVTLYGFRRLRWI